MRKYYLLIVCFLGLLGCRHSANTVSTIWSNEYVKCKAEFPDSLVSHFPIKFNVKAVMLNSSKNNVPQSIKYLVLTKKMDKSEISLIKQLEFADNSCLFPIYLRKIQYGFNYSKYDNCEDILPVPDEKLLFDSPSLAGIDNYIFETSNKAIYHHEDYLRSYLPDNWMNGMSRGISVSIESSLVSYWVILW